MVGPFFEGRLESPPKTTLRSISFNQSIARDLKGWQAGGDEAVDRVITEVTWFFRGTYVDFEGAERHAQRANVLGHFGEDAGRWMRDYLRRADQPYERRLDEALTRRVMFIWLAVEIDRRRHSRV